ncbi:MAG: hypothetical protein J6N49_04265 [Alphaproteobacteria bacterium]|nr:hypothetical protein [Alphaproteobacteria bacterium]
MKQFAHKMNQILFNGNLFYLLFSYKGHIGRITYACGLTLVIILISALRAIHPLVSIIALILKLYCIPALIQKRCRSFADKGTLYITSLFILILALELTYNEDLSVIPYAQTVFYVLMLQFILAQLILLLRPVKNPADDTQQSVLTKIPPVTTVGMICIIFASLFAQDRYLPHTENPAFRLGLAIGEVYRHEFGYPEFCRHYGYEMVNYPQQFKSQYYQAIKTIEIDQMKLLNRAAPNQYKNIEDFYENVMAKEDDAVNNPAIRDFFEAVRKRLIVIQVLQDQRIPEDKFSWKDEYDTLLGYDAACKAVDKDAEYFVSAECPFGHILSYVGLPTECQYK